MIDIDLQKKQNEIKSPLMIMLDANLRLLASIDRAALQCAENFRWMRRYKGKLSFLFDTDVLISAITNDLVGRGDSKINDKQKAGEARDILNKSIDAKSILDFDVFSLSTPHLIREHILSLDRYYIPSGSAVELLRVKKRLMGELGAKSSRLLRKFDALEVDKLAEAKVDTVGELFDNALPYLKDDFVGAVRSAHQRTLLERLVERSQGLPKRIYKNSKGIGEDAFTNILDVLHHDRKDLSINNVYDAANCLELAQEYAFQAARKTRRVLPVLITNTRSVHKIQPTIQLILDQPSIDPDDSPMPHIVGNWIYLLLHSRVRKQASLFYEKDGIDTNTAIETTRSIREAASDLYDSLYKVREVFVRKAHIFSEDLVGRGGKLPGREFLALRESAALAIEFRNVWRNVVGISEFDFEIEFSRTLNRIFDQTLSSAAEGETEDLASLIASRVKSSGPLDNLMRLMLDLKANKSSDEFTGESSELDSFVSEMVTFEQLPNDGMPLRKTHYRLVGSRPLDDTATCRRAAFMPGLLQGIFLALDTVPSHTLSGDYFVYDRLVWLHNGRCRQVCDAFSIICKQLPGLLISESSEGLPPVRLSTDYKQFKEFSPDSASKKLREFSQFAILQLQVGPISFYADGIPYEDIEYHVGVEMVAGEHWGAVGPVITKFIAETSSARMPQSLYATVIKQLFSRAHS